MCGECAIIDIRDISIEYDRLHSLSEESYLHSIHLLKNGYILESLMDASIFFHDRNIELRAPDFRELRSDRDIEGIEYLHNRRCPCPSVNIDDIHSGMVYSVGFDGIG